MMNDESAQEEASRDEGDEESDGDASLAVEIEPESEAMRSVDRA